MLHQLVREALLDTQLAHVKESMHDRAEQVARVTGIASRLAAVALRSPNDLTVGDAATVE